MKKSLYRGWSYNQISPTLIYGKNLKNDLFGTKKPINLGFGMLHCGCRDYQVLLLIDSPCIQQTVCKVLNTLQLGKNLVAHFLNVHSVNTI